MHAGIATAGRGGSSIPRAGPALDGTDGGHHAAATDDGTVTLPTGTKTVLITLLRDLRVNRHRSAAGSTRARVRASGELWTPGRPSTGHLRACTVGRAPAVEELASTMTSVVVSVPPCLKLLMMLIVCTPTQTVVLADSSSPHSSDMPNYFQDSFGMRLPIRFRSMQKTAASERISNWHFAMINDVHRNRYYDQAIGGALSALRSREDNGTGAIVVDLGAGAGLLSALACKHGARKVVSIEAEQAFVRLHRIEVQWLTS
eukprot:SAG31_NODE_5310_length_2617_cov_3.641384_2_plen_259_part_00